MAVTIGVFIGKKEQDFIVMLHHKRLPYPSCPFKPSFIDSYRIRPGLPFIPALYHLNPKTYILTPIIPGRPGIIGHQNLVVTRAEYSRNRVLTLPIPRCNAERTSPDAAPS